MCTCDKYDKRCSWTGFMSIAFTLSYYDCLKKKCKINSNFRLYKEERTDGSHSAVKWTCPNIHDLKNILDNVQIDRILTNVCDKRLSKLSELQVTQLRDECSKLKLSPKGRKVFHAIV